MWLALVKRYLGLFLSIKLLAMSAKMGTAERTQDNMEVRLDAKVTNEKETRPWVLRLETLLFSIPNSCEQKLVLSESRH